MADFYAARAGTNAGAPLDGFLTAVHRAIGNTLQIGSTLQIDGSTVIVDEGNHDRCRRASSAWAKYAEALRRISFACRDFGTPREK